MRGVDNMNDSKIEFNINGFSVKIDNESLTIKDDDALMFIVIFEQVKEIFKLAARNVNDLKTQIETEE